MADYPMDSFAPSPVRHVGVDVYTAAYRVSGQLATRFTRVADIVNQHTGSHLAIEQATVSEYADPAATIGALRVLVTMDEVLFIVAAATEAAGARAEMRIPKRAIRAQLALPPFRLTGQIHVAQGSRPVDGILNVSDRFMAMTEVTVVAGGHPELGRTRRPSPCSGGGRTSSWSPTTNGRTSCWPRFSTGTPPSAGCSAARTKALQRRPEDRA